MRSLSSTNRYKNKTKKNKSNHKKINSYGQKSEILNSFIEYSELSLNERLFHLPPIIQKNYTCLNKESSNFINFRELESENKEIMQNNIQVKEMENISSERNKHNIDKKSNNLIDNTKNSSSTFLNLNNLNKELNFNKNQFNRINILMKTMGKNYFLETFKSIEISKKALAKMPPIKSFSFNKQSMPKLHKIMDEMSIQVMDSAIDENTNKEVNNGILFFIKITIIFFVIIK